MNWSSILTIYGKELRDMLRDRRTVISMIVIPTVAIPGLFALVGFIMFKVAREVASTAPTVMVVGAEDSPKLRGALLAHPKIKVLPATETWRQMISDKKLRAAVEIPAGADAALERGEAVGIKVYNYDGEMRSGRAVGEVRSFINGYADKVVAERLAARGLTPAAIKPLAVQTENVAPPAQVGGNVIGGFIPYLFLVLAFTGAMYPAIDLTAGEKERGTMETLLCSPVGRVEIVLGKFLMILTASLATVAFSLLSMGATIMIGGSLLTQRIASGGTAAATRAADRVTSMMTLDPIGLFAVLGMLLPMVVLFAAVLFAISLFAKSYKEAQSYVSPLILVILMPAMMAMLPGVELNAKLALVPILNVSLASKELVSGVWHWNYLAVIFGSSCLYATIALGLAVRMFNREDVIFRA
jgi:sodium transport system permease protein